jgi:hypothetical protein
MSDNPVNQLMIKMPFHDYSTLIYDEAELKQQISRQKKIPLNPNSLTTVLFSDKANISFM